MLPKLLIYILCVAGFVLQPVFCSASSLSIKIDSPTKSYKNHNLFKLLVTFSNTSEKSFVVFPAYIRREYKPLDGQEFSYIPYTGPVIDPWSNAISLRPGQNKTVTFNGMQDGDGLWGLMPGRYELAAVLNVHAANYDFPSTNKKIEGMRIWFGNIKSEIININYLKSK